MYHMYSMYWPHAPNCPKERREKNTPQSHVSYVSVICTFGNEIPIFAHFVTKCARIGVCLPNVQIFGFGSLRSRPSKWPSFRFVLLCSGPTRNRKIAMACSEENKVPALQARDLVTKCAKNWDLVIPNPNYRSSILSNCGENTMVSVKSGFIAYCVFRK